MMKMLAHEMAERLKRNPLKFARGFRTQMVGNSYCGNHFHSDLEIVYHLRGNGTTTASGKTTSFVDESVVLYAPGQMHDQVALSDGRDLCVHVEIPARLQRSLPGSLYVSHVESAWLIEQIRELSLEVKTGCPVEQSILDLRATAVFLALIHLSSSSAGKTTPIGEIHVRKAENYICRHFAEIDSLNEVSEHAGVSQDHLRHLFRTLRGKSVIRYLNEIRVDRAKSLLIHSRMALKQIAAMCGFNDEYYFSAVFQRYVKRSPSRYRKL